MSLRIPVPCLLLLAAALPAGARAATIQQDAVWTDAAGEEIQAQGGCVLRHGDTFYWYGVAFAGESPAQVRCYASKDLSSWTFQRAVQDRHVSRRVKVLFDPAAGRFVMFTRLGDRLGVSTSAEPAGTFTWKGESPLPGARGEGDVNAFRDDDGKAYVIYPAGAGPDAKDRIVCAGLNADWTAATTVVHTFPEAPLGSPALWKRGATWYCTASEAGGWGPAEIHFSAAPAIGGPWKPWKRMDRSHFNAQHNTVFRVDGAQGSLFVFMGDRWSQFTRYGVGRQVWLPVEFDGDTPVITWLRPWHPDAAQGTYQHELRRYGLYRGWPREK